MRELRARRAFVVEGEYLLRLPDEPPTGGALPVVLLLHGFGDTAFELAARLPLDLPGAALLYAGAPLPVEVPRAAGGTGNGAAAEPGARRIGQTWYCYDGDADRFRDALDEAESYLDALLEDARKKAQLDTARLVVVGYSMGAYVGGYFALRRSPRPLGVALVAGRLKHEFLEREIAAAEGLKVLLLHGKTDAHYAREKADEGKRRLLDAGALVEDEEHPGGHGLSAGVARTIERWARETLTGAG